MKRLTLAALILASWIVPAMADDIVYWPATRQRVYVVDVRNIGPYGTIRKPAGIDVIVVRSGPRWGVLPKSR